MLCRDDDDDDDNNDDDEENYEGDDDDDGNDDGLAGENYDGVNEALMMMEMMMTNLMIKAKKENDNEGKTLVRIIIWMRRTMMLDDEFSNLRR